MKKFFVLLAMATLISSISAQELSTQGTDFWMTFLGNSADNDVDVYYFNITGPRNCTVTLTNPNTSWSHTLNVLGHQVTTYQVASTDASNMFHSGSCTTVNTGIHITATDSIEVTAYNHTTASSDATQLLTTQSLGSEYIIQNYPLISSRSNDSHTEFSIVAVENNTQVEIDFTGATSSTYQSGDHATISLQSGQVFQVKSPATTGDFTGTHITTTDCKPIAVFAGTTMGSIPSSTANSNDHMYQECIPTIYWDTMWILSPCPWRNYDYVRVTSKDDSCAVYVDGVLSTTLNSLQTYEFTITDITTLKTSKPAEVFQYLDSRHQSAQGSDWGDPAMFAPNSVNMTQKRADFSTFYTHSRSVSSKYYVNIVVPNGETNLLQLDGNTLTSFQPAGASGYSVARQSITSGSHTITTTGSGFSAHTYGLGEDWEAYIHTLGGTSIHSNLFCDTIDTVSCNSTIIYNGTNFAVPGTYEIRSCDSDSISLTILNISQVGIIENPTEYESSCSDHFDWRGNTYTQSGTYYDTIHSVVGCDSIYSLSLRIGQTESHISIEACQPYVSINDTIITSDGIYDVVYPSADGCDTLIHINVTLHPDYDTLYIVDINDTENYTWINGVTYDQSSYAEIYNRNQYGCDSIQRLALSVHCTTPDPEDPSNVNMPSNIWVPNIFTPDLETNKYFSVTSENVDKMTVSIYRRWGERVCTFDGLTGHWDGTRNGIKCPQEAYVYIIHYHNKNEKGNPKPIVGTVTLVR